MPFSPAWADEGASLDLAAIGESAANPLASTVESPDWSPVVTIATSQDGLAAGQVRVEVTGTNDSPTTVRGVDVTVALPAGLRMVDGQASAHADALAPGETIRTQAIVTDAEGGTALTTDTDAGSAPKPLAGTGDAAAGACLVVLALLIGAVCVVAIARRRGRRWDSQALSIVVALALVVGLAPTFPAPAAAEETPVSVTGTAQATITLNGRSYDLSASMVVRSADDFAGDLGTEAWLTTETYVAQGATSAHVTLDSDQPFALRIEPSSIKLGDALANCSVVAVDRISDTRIVLTIEGLASEDRSDGSIAIDESAFAAGVVEGFGVIPVEAVVARLEEADASAEEGYLADQGVFVLPVSIGCAEFSRDAAASAFSVPANSAIHVTAVTCEAGGHKALLTFKVPGESPQEQFEALDQALTEGGVLIDSAALNCGTVTATADNVERAVGMPYETTALEYVDAVPVATARVVGVEAPEGDGGPLTLRCEATVGVVDVGTVDLKRAGAEVIDVRHMITDTSVLDGPATATDSATFSFGVALSQDAASLLWGTIEDTDDDGVLEDEVQAAADLLDYAISPCEVVIGGAGVTNAWGIPQNGATASLSYDYGEAAENAAMQANLADAMPLVVEEPDLETVDKSLQAVNEAFHAIGEFVSAVYEKNPGEVFSGVGSVFGFIGSIVGTSEKPTYTMEEVVSRLNTIQASVSSLGTKLDGIGSQIASIEARDAYRMKVDKLVAYANTVNDGIPDLMGTALKSVDLSDNVPFDQMSDGNRRAIKKFAHAATNYATTMGFATTSELVKKLNDLITGTAAASDPGICDLYYAYLDTYYNWEPQTFAARKSFMAYVSSAYVYGYAAAMCELNVAIAEAYEADNEGAALGYETSRKVLAEKADRVMSMLVGTFDKDGNLAASSLQQQLEDRADGKVLNLVTGEAFAKASSVESENKDIGFNAQAFSAEASNLAQSMNDRDLDKFRVCPVDTRITGAQFKEMAARLKANKLAASIAKELTAQGISYGVRTTWSTDHGELKKAQGVSMGSQNVQFVVAVNSDRNGTCNRYAVKHGYTYIGDVFDIETGETKSGVTLCAFETSYRPWYCKWDVRYTVYDFKRVGPDRA